MPNTTENQSLQPPAGGMNFLRKAASRVLEWLGCARHAQGESLSTKVQQLEELLDVVARETRRLKDAIENPATDQAQDDCRE